MFRREEATVISGLLATASRCYLAHVRCTTQSLAQALEGEDAKHETHSHTNNFASLYSFHSTHSHSHRRCFALTHAGQEGACTQVHGAQVHRLHCPYSLLRRRTPLSSQAESVWLRLQERRAQHCTPRQGTVNMIHDRQERRVSTILLRLFAAEKMQKERERERQNVSK